MAEAVMQLRALAERVGILPQYIDNEGQVRETSDETRCALLAALGFEVTDEESARRTLAGLEEESAAHIVEPVRVAHESDAAQITARSLALVPGAVRFEVVATNEASGRQHQARGSGHVRPDRELVGLRAPALSPGTYRLAITLEGAGPRRTIPQWLAIVPATCTPVTEVIRRAAFGIWANLYSVRSGGGVGIGNLDDLRELVRFAASAGAEFMGINPLHALRNRGFEISPYSPLSRLFRNALYVAPARVPELAASRETARLLESSAFARELERARRAERIDYDLVASLHRRILDALWQTFRTGASEARRREFERFRAREGVVLRDFATFSELDERMRRKGINDWRAWPADLRDPDSESVARFRMRNSERVDYHAFVQFECDRQLAAAARTAERAGMAIGLYSDLAVASLASSFDAWEFPGLFVRGACLGAPPDPYSAKGQNWRIPPLHPRRLRAGEYRYWRLLLRAAFRHCGMLRLDHAMAVLRQFWIPECGSGEGAYVRFPAEDLLGLLALESRDNQAVVVAEDLGTVPKGFSELLARHAILSSRVMFFERTSGGGFPRAASYSRRALVTANTHDQPTLAGWWQGRDLEIRRDVGMIPDDETLGRAQATRAREKELLVRRLRAERALARPAGASEPAELCAAVNRYLAATPSPLFGVSLDDLVGEVEPVNVPGINVDRYPSWSRRMRIDVKDLARSPAVARGLAGTRSRARLAKEAGRSSRAHCAKEARAVPRAPKAKKPHASERRRPQR